MRLSGEGAICGGVGRGWGGGGGRGLGLAGGTAMAACCCGFGGCGFGGSGFGGSGLGSGGMAFSNALSIAFSAAACSCGGVGVGVGVGAGLGGSKDCDDGGGGSGSGVGIAFSSDCGGDSGMFWLLGFSAVGRTWVGFSEVISAGGRMPSMGGAGWGVGAGVGAGGGGGGSGGLGASNETSTTSSVSGIGGRLCDIHHRRKAASACSSTASAMPSGDIRSEREYDALTAWATAPPTHVIPARPGDRCRFAIMADISNDQNRDDAHQIIWGISTW